jgi:hypothetical protein
MRPARLDPDVHGHPEGGAAHGREHDARNQSPPGHVPSRQSTFAKAVARIGGRQQQRSAGAKEQPDPDHDLRDDLGDLLAEVRDAPGHEEPREADDHRHEHLREHRRDGDDGAERQQTLPADHTCQPAR